MKDIRNIKIKVNNVEGNSMELEVNWDADIEEMYNKFMLIMKFLTYVDTEDYIVLKD